MAPSNLILRSASISSSSTTSSKSSKSTNDGIKKKFGCNHPGCGKSFSRSEHLHRHALNHKDGNHTCLRCSAHFRRRDLLERHMTRHKEKDDEAGGEGLGVLATRKRLWRDSDGKIVNSRRPSYTQDGNKRRIISRDSHQQTFNRKGSQASVYSEDLRRSSIMSSMSSTMPSPPAPMSRNGSTHSTIIVDTTRGYNNQQQQLKSEEDEEELDHNPSWLPSPPQSAFSATHSPSLPSSAQSSNEDADADGELDTLYEDTTQAASWPLRVNTNSHGIPHILNASTPIQSEYPADPSWGGSSSNSHQQSFQTFMGSVGGFDDGMILQSSQQQPKQEDYGMGMGMGIGGMYGWQNPWASQSQMMLSRVREEKFEGHPQAVQYMNDGMRSNGMLGAQDALRRGFMGAC